MASKKFGHYTSQQGLMGIIGHQKLWATNINFLNDEQEFLHAIPLLKEIIKRASATMNSARKDYTAFESFIARLESVLDKLDKYASESIYTLSFSRKTDLLSQWRGYCPANNGYCLIYDLDKIVEAVREQHANVHVVDCVYKDSQKEEKIKKLLNSYWHPYIDAAEKDQGDMIDKLSKEVMLLASHFKHHSFSEEAETRIVIIHESNNDTDLKFREGRFALIPYLELSALRVHLKEICLGPTSNKELAMRAVRMFLKNILNDSPIPSIGFSKTPYRPW